MSDFGVDFWDFGGVVESFCVDVDPPDDVDVSSDRVVARFGLEDEGVYVGLDLSGDGFPEVWVDDGVNISCSMFVDEAYVLADRLMQACKYAEEMQSKIDAVIELQN